MVNLTIRLSKGGPGGGPAVSGAGAGAVDGSAALGVAADASVVANEPAITVSCPDHLVLADLPVAKGLGSVTDITLVKILGRKARRRLGDKVHFCVRCDFPIAIYGRLDPCEHIFCLTCARRDSACYLCGERVVRIQRMEVLDGVFICGAPRCLRSFIKRQDFQLHIKEAHADLIEPTVTEDRERPLNDIDTQKGAASEAQGQQTQALSHSPSALQLPLQDQRTGQSQLQSSEGQLSRPIQQKSTPPTSFDDKLKQQPRNNDSHRRQRQDRQQMEDSNFEEQVKQDQQSFQTLQQTPPQPQHGMIPASQAGMPLYPPQPFPTYQMQQQDGHNMQPMYPPYQIPPGGHLLPSPPLPPPRPQPVAAPPQPLMPPPPPKRGKFEPGMTPADPQMDPQGFLWPGGNPGYDSNRIYGGWPAQ